MYSRWFMTALATTTLVSAVAADATPAAWGDWPGWRGPERTGVSRETGLLHQWPPGGPKLLWKAKGLGGGYATPSIAADGDLLYTIGSDGDLVCAETASGTIVWQKHLEKDFQGNRNLWAYCESPLIDGDTLVCSPGGAYATLVAPAHLRVRQSRQDQQNINLE